MFSINHPWSFYTHSYIKLHDRVRELWMENDYYIREYMIATAENTAYIPFIKDQISGNMLNISMLYGKYYGLDRGQSFGTLLNNWIVAVLAAIDELITPTSTQDAIDAQTAGTDTIMPICLFMEADNSVYWNTNQLYKYFNLYTQTIYMETSNYMTTKNGHNANKGNDLNYFSISLELVRKLSDYISYGIAHQMRFQFVKMY